jgi:hypothetical protein
MWLEDSEIHLNTNLHYVAPMQLFPVCFHDSISTAEAHSFDMGQTTLTNDVCCILVIHGCYYIIISYK